MKGGKRRKDWERKGEGKARKNRKKEAEAEVEEKPRVGF